MRKSNGLLTILILLSGCFLAFSSSALADDDPPGRVARLNYIQGSISFQPGGESDWVQANPNRPLTTGDNLWADRGSRGELHIGSTSIRIGNETGITFLNLDDRTVQIQLAEGSLNVTVRRLDGGDAFEIDTPNLAFTVERPGNYRVDVQPDGSATAITVRAGEGEVTGGGSEFHMDSGDRATFSGTDTLTFDGGEAGRLDEFDSWCRSRDDREERSQSARYVSRDVIGYDDLDDYGEWRSVPDYGTVWFPTRVSVGWAPYRFGHWAWIAPWGWTWVEDEPWGFAPFHYGRWAQIGGGWCWVPGPVVVRPVYAPALVVFVGGPRFSTSVSFGGGGGVAWFPLGPREVYVPPYRSSERYVQRVNVTNTMVNVVNVTNVYNNVHVNNVTYMHQRNVAAVTAVSHETFVNARSVGGATMRVDPQQMQRAEVQRTLEMRPDRRSVVGAGAATTVKPPESVMRRQVVAKEIPPPQRAPIGGGPQQARSYRQAGIPSQQNPQQIQPRPQQPGQRYGQQGQPQQQIQQQPPQQQIQQHPPQQSDPQSRVGQQQRMEQRGEQQQPKLQQQPPPPQQIQQQPPQQSDPQSRVGQQQRMEQRSEQQQQPKLQQQPPPQQIQQQPPQQTGQQPRFGQQSQQQIQQHPDQQPKMQQPPPQQQIQQQPPQQGGQQPRFEKQPPQRQEMQHPEQQQPRMQQPPPPQQQIQQHPQQQSPPSPRPQADETRRPPEQQNPAVRMAPPARANEDTYHPHQFERPPTAAAPPKAGPPAAAEQPKSQDRGQDSRKSGDNKDRK
jgi:hypothetical protein